MSEIVIGACYRDRIDGEIVRVTRPSGDGVRHECVELVGSHVGEPVDRMLRPEWWERVPDPTPALSDAEPPLAGELTVRQLEAWRDERGLDDISLIYGRGLWHAYAERGGEVLRGMPSSDPQDALTSLMSRVDGR